MPHGCASIPNSYCDFGRSIEERTLVYFAENPRELLEAYVESGEGIDRAGGFAVQVSRDLCLTESKH